MRQRAAYNRGVFTAWVIAVYKRSSGVLWCTGLGLAALLAWPAWAATDSGHWLDLTVHVKQTMSGMAPIAPRTLHKKICVGAGAFDPQAFAKAESRAECSIHNYAKHGNRVKFDVVCGGAEPTTSHGEFQLTGGPDFTGSMHTEFSAAGHAITVDTDYTGKQVAGSCAYAPPGTSG